MARALVLQDYAQSGPVKSPAPKAWSHGILWQRATSDATTYVTSLWHKCLHYWPRQRPTPEASTHAYGHASVGSCIWVSVPRPPCARQCITAAEVHA